ncbi:MAG: glycosyltransferase [Dehalococcoidales bacterium]|nr:glycosyltransferase [Dehalococcoidales bacterium]
MKKVLCIDYFFPPLMGGWWIGTGVIKFLPKLGWQPTVLAAAETVSYGKDYSLLKLIPNDIEVHRVAHREPSREWSYALQKLKLNFQFPDGYKNWDSPALHEARMILQKEKADLIYSASEPYTSHFIAMKLKKEFNIPWVAEFGDPWAGNDFLNRHYDNTLMPPLRQLQKLKIRKGENDILQAADRVIVIHPYHKQQLAKQYSSIIDKIEVVTDGYDESDFKEIKLHRIYPDKLTIVFLGSFYAEFRESIMSFFKAVSEVYEQSEIVFIGRGAIGLQDISMPNLTRILHLVKEKALTFASGADFLFLVMPPSSKWTPSKTYEYLRLGKPILALVPEDGDPAKIIRDAGAGFILSYDVEKMKEQLKTIFGQWRQGKFKAFHPKAEYITQFERRNLTKRLAAVFDKAKSVH